MSYTNDTPADIGGPSVGVGLHPHLHNLCEADIAALAAHLGDTVDAHDASAISFAPAGTIAATTVQAAIVEVAAEAAAGGDVAWTVPTLLNSWVDYGSGFLGARYRKDGSGFVHIDGLVKSGAANTVIFTLPAGYRVEAPVLRATWGVNGTGAAKRINIATNGDVSLDVDSASPDYLSLGIAPFLAA